MRLSIFYEADVAVPAAAAVPKDETALCHVSPDPSAGVTHAIAHGGWTMVRGLVTKADGSGDMTKSGFILRHSSSGRNSNVSRVQEGVRGRAQRRPRKQLRD